MSSRNSRGVPGAQRRAEQAQDGHRRLGQRGAQPQQETENQGQGQPRLERKLQPDLLAQRHDAQPDPLQEERQAQDDQHHPQRHERGVDQGQAEHHELEEQEKEHERNHDPDLLQGLRPGVRGNHPRRISKGYLDRIFQRPSSAPASLSKGRLRLPPSRI